MTLQGYTILAQLAFSGHGPKNRNYYKHTANEAVSALGEAHRKI